MSFVDAYRPLNDLVLVKLAPTQVYSTTLVIPESVANNHPISKGVVVKVGPGRWKLRRAMKEDKRIFVPVDSQVGDNVVFFAAAMHGKKGSGFYREMPDGYALIRDSDVLFTYDSDVLVSV